MFIALVPLYKPTGSSKLQNDYKIILHQDKVNIYDSNTNFMKLITLDLTQLSLRLFHSSFSSISIHFLTCQLVHTVINTPSFHKQE